MLPASTLMTMDEGRGEGVDGAGAAASAAFLVSASNTLTALARASMHIVLIRRVICASPMPRTDGHPERGTRKRDLSVAKGTVLPGDAFTIFGAAHDFLELSLRWDQ